MTKAEINVEREIMIIAWTAEYQACMTEAAMLVGFLAVTFVFIIPVIHRRRRRRHQAELRDRVEKAKAKILEDGVIEGPGPYVPHKSWNAGARAGHSPLTNHETRPSSGGGYYGSG